jgi:hypothetical protein
VALVRDPNPKQPSREKVQGGYMPAKKTAKKATKKAAKKTKK